MRQILPVGERKIGIDAIGKPSIRAPVHEIVDLIRARLKAGWYGIPAGLNTVLGGALITFVSVGSPVK